MGLRRGMNAINATQCIEAGISWEERVYPTAPLAFRAWACMNRRLINRLLESERGNGQVVSLDVFRASGGGGRSTNRNPDATPCPVTQPLCGTAPDVP